MTRMWMCDPRILCRNHLLGEHKELHQLVGSLLRRRSITGYIKNNCVEVKSIQSRHKALVEEMKRRGYNHHSPLHEVGDSYLPLHEREYTIDRRESLQDLLQRCEKCKKK